MILAPLLMSLVSTPAQAAAPIQVCEVRAGAWCLIRSGVYFDAKTVDNDKRTWRLFGPYLGSSSINIVESRACSAVTADYPSRSESLGKSEIDGSAKYIVKVVLNREGTCSISVEIPLNGQGRDEVAYEFAMTGLRAFPNRESVGITLSSIAVKTR